MSEEANSGSDLEPGLNSEEEDMEEEEEEEDNDDDEEEEMNETDEEDDENDGDDEEDSAGKWRDMQRVTKTRPDRHLPTCFCRCSLTLQCSTFLCFGV